MKFNINNTFNLGEFETASNELKIKLAKKLDKICRNSGFIFISNHGIKESVIKNIWTVVDDFFDKDKAFKNLVSIPYKGYPYGYMSVGKEALAMSKGNYTPHDLKESFNGGPIIKPDNIVDNDALDFCYAPTLWPKIHRFKSSWCKYYKEMEHLSKRIMNAFAVALNLPENYFDNFINEPISALRALNYPIVKNNILPDQQRAGAHTDYGSLTILLPKYSSEGLQILNKKQNWIDVEAISGTFIINLGDLMARWTNDRWVSTLHRVISKDSNKARKSLAFFHQPNWNAEIKCLETCTKNKIKYKPIKSGPYLMSKFKSTI